MLYSVAYQLYKYEHGVTATEQRAAEIRAGEMAAELRNLRRSLKGLFRLGRRVRPAGQAAGTVTGRGAAGPARLLSGVR